MSTRMPWFRMYTDFLNDPKMIGLAFEDQRHFIGVLALKSDGAIDDVADDLMLNRIVAQRLWIDHGVILEVKQTLVSAGLINESWQPTEWEKYNPRESARLPAHLWRAVRSLIFTRDDYTCQYCGERGKKLECDHVVPVSKGGSNDESNLVTACLPCNRSKRDKFLHEWRPA